MKYTNRLALLIVWILLTTGLFTACKQPAMKPQDLHHYVFRLKPGQDIRAGIDSVVRAKQIEAGWISACVGSLTDYSIRMANQEGASTGTGHFEIVSLSGTISIHGSHLHISISDSTGKTIGGHLLEGCKVYTTAEIVILHSDRFIFTREKDGSTPWEELQVKDKEANGQ